jgi:hypothetical protein
MKILLRKIFRLLFRIIIRNRWYSILAFFYSLIIKELSSEGGVKHPSKHAKHNKLTILVLSATAFRSDIDCIVATNEIRVLVIPVQWQRRLVNQFYPETFHKFLLKRNPDYSDYIKQQKEIREFLYGFLARLYKTISIDCVISPHPRYVADMDWGAVSTKLGVPHILISRDSQFASSPYALNRVKYLFENAFPRFEGEHIIIQSELDKEVYIDSGYVSPERISSLGRPRMDDFIKKSKEKRIDAKKRRKKVVFLPFSYRENGTFDLKDLRSYIGELQLFFVRFAIKFPEIDVVIKPKAKGLRPWEKEVMIKMIGDDGIESNKLLNLIIRDDIDIHSLFFESDIICGLNTSALLEAAVIGLPVIIPYFKDLQNAKYCKRIYYREDHDLFDIAESAEELESLILKRLQNPIIDDAIMERRKICFEKYISSVKGDATEKYVARIKEIVTKQNRNIIETR